MEKYVSGSATADVALLESIFHPNAVMVGHMAGQLMDGGPKPFFDMLSAQPSLKSSGADYRAEIVSIEVDGDVASATLIEDGFFGMSFTDRFHLVRTSGGWVIVSKLFRHG
jgi:hypothetical protein